MIAMGLRNYCSCGIDIWGLNWNGCCRSGIDRWDKGCLVDCDIFKISEDAMWPARLVAGYGTEDAFSSILSRKW